LELITNQDKRRQIKTKDQKYPEYIIINNNMRKNIYTIFIMVLLILSHVFMAGCGDNAVGSGTGGTSPSPGPINPDSVTNLDVSSDRYRLPPNGIDSAQITAKVKIDGVDQTWLPSGTKLCAKHTNIYATLVEYAVYECPWYESGTIYVSKITPSVIMPGGSMNIDYYIGKYTDFVRFEVLDKYGSRVYFLDESAPAPYQTHTFTWNGKDWHGINVNPDVYSVRMIAYHSSAGEGEVYSSSVSITVKNPIGTGYSDIQYDSQSQLLITSPYYGSFDPDQVIICLMDNYYPYAQHVVAGTGIRFAYGPSDVSPSQSTITASPTNVSANGFSYATITVTAKDGGGNPISGVNVHFTSSRGDYDDFFVTNNTVTDSNGIATVQLKSRTEGPTTVHANVEGIDLYNTVNVNFVEKTIVDEAVRYLDTSADLNNVSWFYRNTTSDVNSTKTAKGIIYSYGNKDDINMFVNYKMKANSNKIPKPQKWSDYIYKTGLDIKEYNAGIDPTGYWAGIDCSGLVQRCANAVGYSTSVVPSLTDHYESQPYWVDNAFNRFHETSRSDQITSNCGSPADFNTIAQNDVIGFYSLISGKYLHWVIVSSVGEDENTTQIIHAYGGDRFGADKWKVIETSLYDVSCDFNGNNNYWFDVYRLKTY
jgi:hypothetical protein